MSGNMNVPPPDMNMLVIIRLTAGQWNELLRVLRTGSGDGINWDTTNPYIITISNQLQSQMYPPQMSPELMQRMRGNGADDAVSAQGK